MKKRVFFIAVIVLMILMQEITLAKIDIESVNELNVTVTSTETNDALLFVALYDNENRLTNIFAANREIKEGTLSNIPLQTLLSLSEVQSDGFETLCGQAKKIKVFIWDEDMCPLSNALTISESQNNNDSLIQSMVRIPARKDFSFRYDLTNKTAGENSPIENDYYISKYKVTNSQYKTFTDETGHRQPSYWKNGSYPDGKGDHPVLNISYSDAAQYCDWLSAKYENWNFRLPTEAEWENAAMGEYYGNLSVKYPDGSTGASYDHLTNTLMTSFNYNGVIASELFKEYGEDYVVHYIKGDFAGESEKLGDCISISENGGVSNWANHGGTATKGYFLQTDLYALVSADGGHTTPVGTYIANSYGLYDMAGNCWDLTSSQITAVNGLEAGSLCYAVRGGSWYATSRSCTFSYRGEGRKDNPSSTVGFRLAADYLGE